MTDKTLGQISFEARQRAMWGDEIAMHWDALRSDEQANEQAAAEAVAERIKGIHLEDGHEHAAETIEYLLAAEKETP